MCACLANFLPISDFEVTSSGSCDGRRWEVAWETQGGDQPAMQANGEGLRGSEPQVNIETMIDGGVWLRPIRGDMLRLPEYEPQVGIGISMTAICVAYNCNYSNRTRNMHAHLLPRASVQTMCTCHMQMQVRHVWHVLRVL